MGLMDMIRGDGELSSSSSSSAVEARQELALLKTPGATLSPGDKLVSPGDGEYRDSLQGSDGQCELRMQIDGNLVLYNTTDDSVVWASDTCIGEERAPYTLEVSEEGKATVVDCEGEVLWEAPAYRPNADIVVVEENVRLMRSTKIVWSS